MNSKEIVVRSRAKLINGVWYTEWSETTRSWKKAWAIVDDCDASRDECHKWKIGNTQFLDIGGVSEAAERNALHNRLAHESKQRNLMNTKKASRFAKVVGFTFEHYRLPPLLGIGAGFTDVVTITKAFPNGKFGVQIRWELLDHKAIPKFEMFVDVWENLHHFNWLSQLAENHEITAELFCEQLLELGLVRVDMQKPEAQP